MAIRPSGAVEPFTFGIALLPRFSAENWALVEGLLDLTIHSVLAQTDPDFRVIVMGQDRPRLTARSRRIQFVESPWPAEPQRPDNLDSWRKKHAINDLVRDEGGGLLMLLDADDWVDTRLVEIARSRIGRRHAGGLIDTGFATDIQTLRAARLPHVAVFDGGFHRLCGSCGILRLDPAAADQRRRDPYKILLDHESWPETARAHGVELARLPVVGNYLINTSENHSEVHGPFADWRRHFTATVNRHGTALDAGLAARFGLDLQCIADLRARFYGRRHMAAAFPSHYLPGNC